MPIAMMGTIDTYTKTLKLQTQWDLKKQSGNVTSHQKSLDEWLQSDLSSTSDDENGDSQLKSIQSKLDSGKN